MALSANDDSNWKQKYLDHLDHAESKEKQWKQDEELLKHSLGRVALAAGGIDGILDQQLKTLRKLLRQDDVYHTLKQTVTSISDTVKNLDDSSEKETSIADMLAWMVDRIELPKKYKKNSNQLKKQLAALETVESADLLVESYTTILNEALLSLQDNSPSWLQKIFGDKDDLEMDYAAIETADDPSQPEVNDLAYCSISSELLEQLVAKLPSECFDNTQSKYLNEKIKSLQSKQATVSLLDDIVKFLQKSNQKNSAPAQNVENMSIGEDSPQMLIVNQFCLKLLETLNFPNDLQAPAIALRDRVVDGLAENEIPGILKAIADLVITIRNRIETEKKSLQDFLLQLTGHLNDIDSNLSGIIDISVKSGEADNKFNQQISEEMESLSQSVQQADSLDMLKETVQNRVKAIQTHISQNKNSLYLRQENLEKALNKSSARLKKLEQEGDTLREQLSKEHAQATHDVLTGLHNRLAYEEHVHMEYARWKRYKKPFSLLIFDIDFFKKINDTYGHKAGDNALRLIAKRLNSNIRETDFIARYGGEEFLVLMPETNIDDAMLVAEKLRKSVAEVNFNYMDKPVPVTISCGATEFQTGDSIDLAFERADQALYHAKKLGRNQCYTSPKAA